MRGCLSAAVVTVVGGCGRGERKRQSSHQTPPKPLMVFVATRQPRAGTGDGGSSHQRRRRPCFCSNRRERQLLPATTGPFFCCNQQMWQLPPEPDGCFCARRRGRQYQQPIDELFSKFVNFFKHSMNFFQNSMNLFFKFDKFF